VREAPDESANPRKKVVALGAEQLATIVLEKGVVPLDIQRLAQASRAVLLARIRTRLGAELARVLDAEDVFQESLAAAIHACGRVWRDSRSAFHGYLMSIAERRIRHEARSQLVRRSLPLDDQAVSLSHRRRNRIERAGRRGSVSRRSFELHPNHRWVVFLRDWMHLDWGTVEFLMERSSRAAVQGLHHRARTELGGRLNRSLP
jgi:DNA-directed RNA polymerase specialized sigma24 family protein